MKKSILFMVVIILAVAKTSMGQYKSNDDVFKGITFVYMNFRYEYHPYIFNTESGFNIEAKNMHTGKFGIIGISGLIGKNKKTSFEWTVLTLSISSCKEYKENPLGVSFLDFVIRRELGRFSPFVSLDLLEFYKNNDKETTIHNSVAGGVDFYLTERSILSLHLGLTHGLTPANSFISPFIGIGYRIERRR